MIANDGGRLAGETLTREAASIKYRGCAYCRQSMTSAKITDPAMAQKGGIR